MFFVGLYTIVASWLVAAAVRAGAWFGRNWWLVALAVVASAQRIGFVFMVDLGGHLGSSEWLRQRRVVVGITAISTSGDWRVAIGIGSES